MDRWPHEDDPPVPRAVAAVVFFSLTLALVAVVGLTVFDLTPDEGVAPQVNWSLEAGDRPILGHNGGDEVRCDRITVEGDLGSDESLCVYFEDEYIGEGDVAPLMDTDGQAGTIKLVWHDVETGRSATLIQWDYP